VPGCLCDKRRGMRGVWFVGSSSKCSPERARLLVHFRSGFLQDPNLGSRPENAVRGATQQPLDLLLPSI
jgi:hypothetical protein